MLTVVGVLVNVSYALRRRWLHVGTWLAALAGGAVLNQLLKALFSRPRPSFVDPLLTESGYSFPSGHAMLSLVVYGVLAYFVVLDLRTWRARYSRSLWDDVAGVAGWFQQNVSRRPLLQ
jgi:membrane-associated phospholipid phosphatase